MSDSTRPGVLPPTAFANPENDGDLDAIIQAWTVLLIGIPGNLVRPRWQPTPPPQPPQDVNWLSIGCLQQTFDDFSFQEQVDDDHLLLHRHETIEYHYTFYGPNASGLAIRFRDGAQITQNRDMLAAHGINLLWIGSANNTPQLANEIFRGNCDMPVHFRREIKTSYPVRTLLSAPISIANDPS